VSHQKPAAELSNRLAEPMRATGVSTAAVVTPIPLPWQHRQLIECETGGHCFTRHEA
jgi:hypothetical protein